MSESTPPKYPKLIVGIDPDSKKSGYAELNYEANRLIKVTSLSYFDVFERLKELKASEQILMVRVEAGYLNEKANFHGRSGQSKAAGERIAKNVGTNHEAARKIVEMCEYLEIPYQEVRPLGTKNITHRLFSQLTGWIKITNQDNRDAAMLIWDYKLPREI